MREREDFTDFVVARWARLVAALTAEGVPPESAATAVARGLAACRRGWRRTVREDDVEMVVWAAVRAEAGLPRGSGLPVDGPDRLDDPSSGGLPAPTDPVGLVAAEVRRRRIRSARVLAGSVVVVLLVVALGAWWAGRPAPPEVVRASNPVPVPWYADGRLHLADVVVTLPGVTALVPAEDGAVVRRAAAWWRVSEDGDVDRLEGAPRSPGVSPVPPVSAGLVLGPADRVVDGIRGPGGVVVHLVDNGVSGRVAGSYVRLSETGRSAFVVCRDEGRSCGSPVLVSTSGEGVRLR